MTVAIDDNEREEEGIELTFDDPPPSEIGDITPHMDTCECEECCPPDWRPLPLTEADYPAAEPMYSLSELRSLLAGIDIGEGTLSLPEPVRVFGSLYWSAIEVRWALEDAAWRARHVEG